MCDNCYYPETELKYKSFTIEVKDNKQITKDGIEYGIISGYASTYGNIDRGGDIIMPGAFAKSLERHKQNDRPIRMLYQHDRQKLIGGFPISKVKDDEKGLYVEGEINLNVPEGKAAYALAKQGVLTDLSIGYTIIESEFSKEAEALVLKELELWEVSTVSEPMNAEAVITDVKGATSFKNLPLAERTRRWTASQAASRVRKATGSEEKPSASYRNAFLWFDGENSENFTAYKLPFADVVNGRLTAIPRAIFNAAARLNQTQIPAADKKRVATHINRYYKKMGLESPLKSNGDLNESLEWIAELVEHQKDLEDFDCMKDIENFLKNPFPLSGAARKTLISKIKSFSRDVENDFDERDVHDEEKKESNLAVNTRLDKINELLRG